MALPALRTMLRQRPLPGLSVSALPFYIHNAYLALNFFIFRLAKFFVQALGARILAPVAFGYFSYLYSLLDIWNHVFGAGLEIKASRSWPGQGQGGAPGPLERPGHGFWPQIVVGRLVLSFAGAATGLVVFRWPYNLLFALWHVFFLQSRLAYSFVNTLLYPRGIVISGFVSQGMLAICAYWGLKRWGLTGFMAAFVLERLAEGVCLWVFVMMRRPEFLGSLRAALWPASWLGCLRRWLTQESGTVIWVAQLLGVLGARLDSVIVQLLLGYSSLAFYSLSFRTCEAPLFLFAAIADSSLAYFVRHPQERGSLYRQGMKMALGAGFALALAVTIFGIFGASFVFGPNYPGVGSLIAVASWVLIPRGANMVSTSFLLATGGEKILLLSSASGMAFGLLANIALIPWFGVWAPAIVAIAAESVTGWMRYELMRSVAR